MMTMDQLLDQLLSKAKVEGEEAVRELVYALNGLAGIAQIEGKKDQAVIYYVQVNMILLF